MQERQPLVDLFLLVVAILREALVEEPRQQEVALGRLGRDRDEAPVLMNARIVFSSSVSLRGSVAMAARYHAAVLAR